MTKYFYEENNNGKIIEGVKNSVKTIAQSNFLECIDTTIPTISVINKGSINQINEKNEKTPEKSTNTMLQQILKTEISSINGMENIEKKARKYERWN